MTAALKTNGPTSAPTLNRAGSTNPTKDKEMNDTNPSTLSSRDKDRRVMNRRTVLKGGIVLAATSHTAVATADVAPAQISIDDFLSKATAAEKARYHANALTEVMAELHPHRSWRNHIDHEHNFCLIVGDPVTL